MIVFVHKYKYSHERKRRKYKKLLKNKEVVLVRRVNDGWYYKKI